MSTKPACHGCICACWDPGQATAGFAIGFPGRPSCVNRPGYYGQMKPTPVGQVCRNCHPKPPAPKGDVERIRLAEGLYAATAVAECPATPYIIAGGLIIGDAALGGPTGEGIAPALVTLGR